MSVFIYSVLIGVSAIVSWVVVVCTCVSNLSLTIERETKTKKSKAARAGWFDGGKFLYPEHLHLNLFKCVDIVYKVSSIFTKT